MSIDGTSRTAHETAAARGVPPLVTLYVYAAGSCNLACRHCWISPVFRPEGGGPFIGLRLYEKAVREALPLGLKSVKLTGGEPLLHPELRRLIEIISEHGLRLILETNGTLIDAELSRFIVDGRTPKPFLSVSIDGACAETHDALRGVEGSFERTIAGVRHLVDAGLAPQIICTLHRGNVDELADLVHLGEKIGCASVKLNQLHDFGRGAKLSVSQGLTFTEILDIQRMLESEIIPFSSVPVLLDIPIAFHPLRRLVYDQQGRCTVLNILGVLASGQLSLCGIGEAVPELIYGDLEEHDVATVWRESPGLAELRKQVPHRLGGICGDCIHRDRCMGTCVAHNYFHARRLDAPFSFCHTADELGGFPTSRRRSTRLDDGKLGSRRRAS